MALDVTVEVIATQLWPQGDARDPLGVWGGRAPITGDASGDGLTAFFFVPAARRAAYVYTCYGITAAMVAGTLGAGHHAQSRLLTNWPDIDPITLGVQGYATLRIAPLGGNSSIGPPGRGPLAPGLHEPTDRFIILFDYRLDQGDMNIVEINWSENVNAATYVFECWGYFWDRSVMNAPGGLRHPGSN